MDGLGKPRSVWAKIHHEMGDGLKVQLKGAEVRRLRRESSRPPHVFVVFRKPLSPSATAKGR